MADKQQGNTTVNVLDSAWQWTSKIADFGPAPLPGFLHPPYAMSSHLIPFQCTFLPSIGTRAIWNPHLEPAECPLFPSCLYHDINELARYHSEGVTDSRSTAPSENSRPAGVIARKGCDNCRKHSVTCSQIRPRPSH